MRFLVLLALIVGVYFVFVRSKSTPAPDSTPAAAASAASPQQTNLLKQPTDHTKEVLKAVEKRNADGF